MLSKSASANLSFAADAAGRGDASTVLTSSSLHMSSFSVAVSCADEGDDDDDREDADEEDVADEEERTNSTWKFSGGEDVDVSTLSSTSGSSAAVAGAVSERRDGTAPLVLVCALKVGAAEADGGGGKEALAPAAPPAGGRDKASCCCGDRDVLCGEPRTADGCSSTFTPCGVTKWTRLLECGTSPGCAATSWRS